MRPSLRQALARSLTPATGPASRRQRWTLAAILAYQVGVCLWLGWPDPGPGRWWDEGFNVRNIESSLRAGWLAPDNGYYGGVSYLPQLVVLAAAAKAHALTGWRVVDDAGLLTPFSYHVLRASQALAAALALLAIYALTRRLASANTALAAAALAAVSPRLIHAGAIFKPDIVLLAATVLAILAAWLAASRAPHSGRYLAAGLAIGLAVGAKLNGVTAAAPLILATALRWREWGRWPRLALAGAASFATYWLFNPDLARTLRALARNREHYDSTASGGRFAVLAETVSYPFRAEFHGPLVAALAAIGLLAVAWWTLRRLGDEAVRLGWWMLLTFPLVYYAVYVGASPRAKENHFLQVVPLVAIFAAVVLVAVFELLASRPRAWSRLAAAAWVVLGVGVPAVTTFATMYQNATPTTWELAQRWVEGRLPAPLQGRRILTSGQQLRGRHPGAPAYAPLPEAGEGDFAAGDGAIASEVALGSMGATRLPQGEQARFEPAAFRARGEPVLAVLFPRPAKSNPAAGRLRFHRVSPQRLEAVLPAEIEPGTPISVRLRLRLRGAAARGLQLEAGSQTYDWTAGPPSGADVFYLSPTFPAPSEGALRAFLPSGRMQPQANGELFVWAQP